eukprot:355951-Hanusia_phi.AAC.1
MALAVNLRASRLPCRNISTSEVAGKGLSGLRTSGVDKEAQDFTLHCTPSVGVGLLRSQIRPSLP